MPGNFTYHSYKNIPDVDAGDYSVHAIEYLNNPSNFRSFSEGLTELIQKYGYNGAADNAIAKTNYILEKLSDINITISKSTVKDWFCNKRRPALVSNSRTIMFQVCFAIKALFDDVKWFFSHVYFDRNFNCHTIEEAVYYYCFIHNLPYKDACRFITIINSYPESKDMPGDAYTNETKDRISLFNNDTEFLGFFKENKGIFQKWNKTALLYINQLLSYIRGKKDDKNAITAYKNENFSYDITGCGLVIQEYLHNYKNNKRVNYIYGQNIASIDFMLEQIINTNIGISKETIIPAIVKVNFPSKKTFSDILTNAETSTSYDSIRKCLILLKFYHFFINLELNPGIIENYAYTIYYDETNDMLYSCGYEELFPGNPYDWLFLWSARQTKPLDALRNAINTLEYS